MSDQFNVQPGTVFAGDFRVDRALSQGGMGAVYVAEQISTGKPRALKVMLPALVSDPSLRKRFEQEARIGSLIESEHVVEVVGAGIDTGTGLPWLAMELLQGEDLDHVVTERGALSVHEVAQLFQQLCHAVGAAHKVGVVHRDLKPENVFLAKARRADATFMVKVLDFGIAKIVAEASTKQTAAMGSPIWMAPEQADQSSVTPATDVWALGLIAFFLLTGRPFWRSANDDNSTIPMVLKEVLFEPIAPASVRAQELGRGLPFGFEEWFSHCVARDPAMRFPDAGQAGDALVSILGGAPPPSVLASEAYPGGYGGPGGPIAATGMLPSSGGGYGSGPMLPSSGGAYGSGPVRPPSGGGYGSGPVVPTHTGPMPQQGYVGTSGNLGQQGGPPATPQMPMQPGVSRTGVPGAYTIPEPGEVHPVAAKKFPLGAAIAIILAVAGAGAVGVFFLTKKPAGTSATVTPIGSNGPVSSSDAAIVAEAKKLSEDGKFDLAHQRLQQIPAGSEARQSDAYRDVEFKWATETLLLAEKTSDLTTKRALLTSVTQCASVDETLRASAKDKLAAIDGPDGGPVARGGGRHPSSAAQPPPPPSSGATLNNPITNLQPGFQPTPPPPPPPPSPFGNRTVSEVAASTNQADWATVRQVEDPRVRAQTATLQEAHALGESCRKLKDKPCETMAKQYIKNHR